MLTYSLTKNIGSRIDGTATSTPAIVNITSPSKYSQVTITNHDAATPLWVDIVQRGGGAPAMSATGKLWQVNPGQTLSLNISETVSVALAASVSVAYSVRASN